MPLEEVPVLLLNLIDLFFELLFLRLLISQLFMQFSLQLLVCFGLRLLLLGSCSGSFRLWVSRLGAGSLRCFAFVGWGGGRLFAFFSLRGGSWLGNSGLGLGQGSFVRVIGRRLSLIFYGGRCRRVRSHQVSLSSFDEIKSYLN